MRIPLTLPMRDPWQSQLHSLIGAENSLLIFEKFPVRPSREFGVQGTENAGKIRLKKRPGGAILRKFPDKSLLAGNFTGSSGLRPHWVPDATTGLVSEAKPKRCV